MKKFLTVFFALALVAAFAMPAAAVDVSVKGEYFITGNYQDNPTMQSGDQADSASSQWTHQRFRPQIDFKVQEGLKLTVRIDIMEKYWGQSNEAHVADSPAGINNDNETNIEFDRVFITANVGPGVLQAGESDVDYGMKLNNFYGSGPRVKYAVPFGNFVGEVIWTKKTEKDIGTTVSDEDKDEYAVGLMYKLKKGYIGFYNIYTYDQATSATATTWTNAFEPYFSYKFGDITLQGEFSYSWGETDYDAASTYDPDLGGFAMWLGAEFAKGDLGVGGQFYYLEGDDSTTSDNEGSVAKMGLSPLGTLIMFDYFNNKFNGVNSGAGLATNSWGYGYNNNIMAVEVHASYKVLPKLTLKAQYTYADTVEKVSGHMEEPYGSEFDLTATYKIYDNLQYMVGFGYLWAGDYWKTSESDNTVDDDYIVLNQLKLTF